MSVRTMHDVAYERGEDYDPAALGDVPRMAAELTLGAQAGLPIEAPAPYDRRRRRARERRAAQDGVPEWLEASDLVEPLLAVHGELV
ncbi:MAG: hypothetical protein MSC31_16990 [Solirubrobacteraceae bacterium MAG38_C4-C5]|nr:hypothetical protein [Candidatus Siliceabacter maunaloa]